MVIFKIWWSMKSLIVFYFVSEQDKGIHIILGMFSLNSVAREMICEVSITKIKHKII